MNPTENGAGAFEIEEVQDVRALWADLEPLITGIIEYHRPWDPRRLREDWVERMQDHLAKGPEMLTLLGRNDAGRPMGFLSGSVRRDFGIFDEVLAFIDNIFVEEQARGSGLGPALVARFEAWAHQQGATEVSLHVTAGNTLGENFWNREGFTTVVHLKRKSIGAPT